MSLLTALLFTALLSAIAATVTVKVLGPDLAPIAGAKAAVRFDYDDTYYAYQSDKSGIFSFDSAGKILTHSTIGYATV
jgi:hypothetical protein